MTSLTETAYYARMIVNRSIILLISYFILKLLWGILFSFLIIIFPPKPIPPNHAFGVLPSTKFPAQASPSAQLTFKLETIEGSVPKASASATVYFMPKSAPNFLALNKTQTFAAQLQFSPNPIQETKNTYRFNDAQLTLRTLRYDIITDNFVMKYNYGLDPGIFSNTVPPTADLSKNQAINLLETSSIYPKDFHKGPILTTHLQLVGDTLIPSISVAQANAIRVDFFRQGINGMNMYYPDPSHGPISIIYAGSVEKKKQMIEFTYTYWPVDYATKATYGLKPSTQAWQELQQGKAYFARLPKQGTAVTVRTVRLGYYDSIESQPYLQPIFVFEGDDGFLAYVSAIAAPWIENN